MLPARDGDDAAAVERLDVRARETQVHRVDVDARGQFRFVDGLFDRCDGGLEIDDDAATDPSGLRKAEPDDVESRVARHLPDDRGDLRGADVEADQRSVFTRHSLLPFTAGTGEPAISSHQPVAGGRHRPLAPGQREFPAVSSSPHRPA